MSQGRVFYSHYINVSLRMYWNAPFGFLLWLVFKSFYWLDNEKWHSFSVGRNLNWTQFILLSVNWSILSRTLVCKYKHVRFRLVNKQALRWFYLSFDAQSVLAKAACHSDRWPETPEVVAVLQVRLQDAMTVLPSERVEFSHFDLQYIFLCGQTAIKLVFGAI